MKILAEKINVFKEGNSNAVPLLFIHGFPFDHTMWRKQIDELNSQYFCISYNIRGIGMSLAGDEQFTMDQFANNVLMTIDELKLNKPVICGLSMGGYVALRTIEKMENKFRGLILCDTKSASDTDEARLKRAEGIKKINTDGLEQYISDFIQDCFSDEFKKKNLSEYNEIVEHSLGFDPIGVKGCLLAMAGRTDTTSYLSKIKIPTLVLCGEKDNFTPPNVMKEMAEQIPDSEFYVVPNAGHISPLENPEFVNQKILNFLEKLN
jgi:3-oxoadipate enol-lactonase